MNETISKWYAPVALALVMTLTCQSAWAAPTEAEVIHGATGVKGGLVVQIGCGDPALTAALCTNDSYLVQGLDTSASNVERSRELITAKGLYGDKVTVKLFDGKTLPYAKDMVNLVVAEDLGEVPLAEVLRVLAPEGVAYIKTDSKWQKTVKPRPADIDEWTHFLHDAGGSATAQDRQVAPPRRLRWVAGPRWCRTHETPSSINSVVTAGGRVFSIIDESVRGVYHKMPWKCMLVARDAFSGVLLWKVPMRETWQPEFGTGTGNRWQMHHTIPRRLVTDGDRVYVTLNFLKSPVSVLDAATGEILVEALEGTQGADELLVDDGVLIAKTTEKLSVGATARAMRTSLVNGLTAVDLKTGKMLWRKENARVLPYALAMQDGKVVYHNMDAVICVDARTGKEAWQAESVIGSIQGGQNTLVISDGVVLYHGTSQTPVASKDGKPAKGARGTNLTAFSLADGTPLWQKPGQGPLSGACTQPTDLFVMNGSVWCGSSRTGWDIKSGEVVKTVTVDKLISPGHHERCHRAKATERFIIGPKRGAEFIDIEEGEHMRADWLRAPCMTGPTPANGLFYVPSEQCFCYPGVKVPGYTAFSGDMPEALVPSGADAVEKGPAFGNVTATKVSDTDWPMYRQNIKRSGSVKTDLPADLDAKWQLQLDQAVTQPVIVGDRLWVAEKNLHRVRCFDAGTGEDVWSFTAAGRIDSTPTVVEGMVLFGCRDGSVYALRAEDGALVWKFQAAPNLRQIYSYGQLESIWPVMGSVLVQDGVVYFAAGRSSFLDGGIIAYGIDAKTGEPLYNHVLEGPWPDIKTDTGKPFAMEGALPDIFVSDGKDLYMMRIKFDAKLNRIDTPWESSLGELSMGENHLVATGGFLDDSGFDRLYWMYGKRYPGFYFAQHSPKAGQLVVFDDTTTYAVKYFYKRHQWSPLFIPGEQGYLLFADDNDNEPTFLSKDRKTLDWLPDGAAAHAGRRGGRGTEKGTGYVREKPEKWQTLVPLRIRAMLLADDLLFTAGTPDVVKEDDPLGTFEGRVGAELRVFSASGGKALRTYPLPGVPTFDAMSTAGGKLYLTTTGGKLLCYGKLRVSR